MAAESPAVGGSVSIDPTSASFQGGGGPGAIAVTAPPGTNWTATSNQTWVTITAGSSGSGTGTVSYNVAINSTGVARSATITINSAINSPVFNLNQAALVSVPPTNVSVTPSSGSGTIQAFSFVASSPNGYSYINWVQVLFNYGLDGAGACWMYIDRASRLLYLYNDVGNGVVGSAALGSAGSLQNSQCQVSLASSSVSESGNNLTLNLALTFQPSFMGPLTTWMVTGDLGGLQSNWQQLGTWTAYTAPSNLPPTAVSVTPSSGSGTTQTFSYVGSSPNGYGYIPAVYALINSTLDGANACYWYYNRAGSYFVLTNDANNGWAGWGYAGAAGTLENSQCILNLAASSASGSGNNLTVNAAITFKAAFAGSKNNYLLLIDRAMQNSGWVQLGTWTVPSAGLTIDPTSASFQGGGGPGTIAVTAPPGTNWTATSNQTWVTITGGSSGLGNGTVSYSVAINSTGVARSATITINSAINSPVFNLNQAALVSVPPTNVSLSPSSGSGASQTFSFVVSSPNGYSYINWVQVLLNYGLDGAGSCYMYYDRPANLLSLADNNGWGWVGSATLGSAGPLENSQCQVNLSASSVSGSGNNLTLNLALTFQPSFMGPLTTWMVTGDLGGLQTNWQQMGTWTAYAAPSSLPPTAVSVTPSSGSGTTQTFSYVGSSPNGYAYIPAVYALINSTLDGANACYWYYNRAGSYFVLMNDANNGWAGSGYAGAAGTLENSQCILNLAASSASGSGNNLTVMPRSRSKLLSRGARTIISY